MRSINMLMLVHDEGLKMPATGKSWKYAHVVTRDLKCLLLEICSCCDEGLKMPATGNMLMLVRDEELKVDPICSC
jgi:hypothetical protein